MRKLSVPFLFLLIIFGLGYYTARNYSNVQITNKKYQAVLAQNQKINNQLEQAKTKLKKAQDQLAAALNQNQKNDPNNLANPVLNEFQVQVWANMAAVRSYSFDFLNYQSSFKQIKKYFTPSAYKLYTQALDSSNTLINTINQKMVVTAVATGAVTVTPQGVINGIYTWKAMLPVKVTMASSTKQINANLNIEMTLIRTNQEDNIQGLAITQFTSTAPISKNPGKKEDNKAKGPLDGILQKN